jgi:hypothetical protein
VIFFLNRAGPIRLHQSLKERGRSALLALQKRLKPGQGGALAVQRNLIRELELQKDFFWAYGQGASPVQPPVDVAWVVSSIHDLRHGIRLKEEGRVRHLWAGPNITVIPQEGNGVLLSKALDRYILPGKWSADFVIQEAPLLAGKTTLWPVGIDTAYWTHSNQKKARLLIYNKYQDNLCDRILKTVNELKISAEVIRYGSYVSDEYRRLLETAWGIVWLSASESQGLAVLEAFSMDVPVLAWDQGRFTYHSNSLKKTYHFDQATSVPYFDNTCGMVFSKTEEFPVKLTDFMKNLESFRPRKFVFLNQMDLENNLRRLAPLKEI